MTETISELLSHDGHSAPHDPVAAAEQIGRPRTTTTTAEIDSTINHPGSVKINVKGAFIVDQSSSSPVGANFNGRGSPDHHQTKDIRLPNHTAVISHIAIDVSRLDTPYLLSIIGMDARGISSLATTPTFPRPMLTGQELTALSSPDRRLPRQARLLFPRGLLHRARRPAELHLL